MSTDHQDAAAGWNTVARALLWLGLSYYTFRLLAHGIAGVLTASVALHLVDLVFHEAGHVILSPFGRLVGVLGGSLAQCVVPFSCAVALLRHGDRFGMQVCGWWLGENFVDLAPYVNDARDLRLVLLGGRTGAEVEGHDWETLLQSVGLLHWDHRLASAIYALGAALMLAMLFWTAYELLRDAFSTRAPIAAAQSRPLR